MYNELYHHGIKGMHWGVRRYQNADGSLTSAGKKRYNVDADNLSGYSKLANTRIASRMRKGMSYNADLEIARINREKANIKNAIRELDDSERAASKNGVANGSWSKASRMAERARLARLDKDTDYRLEQATKKRDQLSAMQKNADKYKSDSNKTLTKEQIAEIRKGRMKRSVDDHVKALSSAGATAGLAFVTAVGVNKLLARQGAESLPVTQAVVGSFIGGYVNTRMSQLYRDAGVLQKRER